MPPEENDSSKINDYKIVFIMKKITLIAGFLSLVLNAVAAVTPTGKLNIALNSAGQEEKVLRLRQHASFSDAFDNTWDAEAVTDGGIYVLYGGDHYTTWASNQFVNLPVGFGAIEDNDYTITFSNFAGEEISFKDLVTGDEIILSSATTYPYVYNFSISDAQKNSAINDRFVIGMTPPPTQSICFYNNILEIDGHAGESLVVKQDDTEIANEASLPVNYVLDLNSYSGRMNVKLNAEEFIIDVLHN